MKKLTNCPLCHNHCPIDEPNCGRGRALAEQIKSGVPVDPDALTKQSEHGHDRDLRGRKDRDSLEGLLRECGHTLHHGERHSEELFSALNDEEQAILKQLLQKLITSWN